MISNLEFSTHQLTERRLRSPLDLQDLKVAILVQETNEIKSSKIKK